MAAKKNRIYFNKDTENAVVKYNTLEKSPERRRLYTTSIRGPLRQLIEAVIHRYKYYNTGIEFRTLVDDCEGFLILQFPKVNIEKGKVFSYLTVVLRNYLTAQSKRNQKNNQRTTDIDDDWYVNDNLEVNYELREKSKDVIDLLVNSHDTSLFITELVETVQDRIAMGYPPYTPKDITVFEALVLVLEHKDILEILTKKYLLYILREITGYKTKAISSSLKKLHEDYHDLKEKHL